MLKLLYSVSLQNGINATICELHKKISEQQQGQVLIVPEQFSFSAEWLLCNSCGDASSRYAEVLSFSRLATRVFSECGGSASGLLDESGRLLAMAKALELSDSELRVFAGQKMKPDFLMQLLDVYDELKNDAVLPSDIDSVVSKLDGVLASKIDDIRLIFRHYEELCTSSSRDPAMRLERLCSVLSTAHFAEGKNFYIAGFFDFTALELKIIGQLMRRAESVTVALTLDSTLNGQNVFQLSREAARHLIYAASQAQIPSVADCLPNAESNESSAIINRFLFANADSARFPDNKDVFLTSGATPFAECEGAIGRIQQLLSLGARYKDIAVCYTDKGTFLPKLQSLFSKYSIPAYYSGTETLSAEPPVRMLFAALDAVCNNLDLENVLDYLKSGYSPAAPDEADMLSNFASVRSFHGDDWKKLLDGQLKRDSSRTAESTELNGIAALGNDAIGPLVKLRKKLFSTKKTSDQISSVCAFISDIGLAKRLASLADEYAGAEQFQLAQKYSQIYDAIIKTLEQMYSVLGNTSSTPAELSEFLKAALSCNKVGTIPATVDVIHVGSLSDMRYSFPKHLILIGASDTLVPSAASNGGLLSDTDRKKLSDAGLNIPPAADIMLQRELLCAYAVLGSFSVSAWISCREGEPSFLFSRLQKLFPNALSKTVPVKAVSLPQYAACILPLPDERKAQLYETYEGLRSLAEELSARINYCPGKVSPETAKKIFESPVSVSASKLDTFFGCKAAFFFEHGLEIKELRPAENEASLYGSFVHYVLEKTTQSVMNQGGFHKVSKEITVDIAESHINEYVHSELHDYYGMSRRDRFLFQRNLFELRSIISDLWDEMSVSLFQPFRWECSFETLISPKESGTPTHFRLCGRIDRIDTYTDADGKVFYRIIDYKTGNTSYDYTDLQCGKGLQLVLYLLAVSQENGTIAPKNAFPAGILYFPAKHALISSPGKLTDDALRSERNRLRARKGILLNNQGILKAMEPSDKPVFMPYSISDGKLAGSVASERQFRMLEQYALHMIDSFSKGLRSGDFRAEPYSRGKNTACDYCVYGSLCHQKSHPERRSDRKEISAEMFWNCAEGVCGDNV